jgi:sugar/nucleoside kinase (ribokinase family)
MLNVAFTVHEMRREFGGCAGNIGYNLKLLGGAPVMMASIGDGFTSEWLWRKQNCAKTTPARPRKSD